MGYKKIIELRDREIQNAVSILEAKLGDNTIIVSQFREEVEKLISRVNKNAEIRLTELRMKQLRISLYIGVIALIGNCFAVCSLLASDDKNWYIYALIQLALIFINVNNFKKYIKEYRQVQIELVKKYLV